MKMCRWSKGFIIVSAIVILLSVIATGCNDYEIFILSDIVPSPFDATNFSIEYPSRYKGLFVHSASQDWVNVTNSPPGTVINDIPDISLWISAFKPSGDSAQDYHELIEGALNYARVNSPNDFELVERSEITIDGAQGERIAFYYLRDEIPDVCESVLGISYGAYYENKGFLWLISVAAISEKAEQVKTDFEFIINSFKFLD